MRSKYGMNIQDDQIDKNIEEAKSKKRMYPFPEKETNYLRYDEKGKSFISSCHGFGFAHYDNKEYFDERNDPNSYDGIAKHLIKVSWVGVHFQFNHIKPGNYKLFLNQCFEDDNLKGKMTLKVFVTDKEIFVDNQFPNEYMIQEKQLSEIHIKDIKPEDFDMSKLDQNGDGVIKIEFSGNDNSWKKGWTIDGARLIDLNPPSHLNQPKKHTFADDIRDMRNKYGMNIPDDQIDQNIEEAKSKKRMYPFPEKETNYVRYDEKGKSYISSCHGFGFAHSDNKEYFDEKNDPNSYDGIAKHLIKVSWLSVHFQFNHIKPGNYKLFLNQCFEDDKLKGAMTFRVFVTDKEIFVDNQFPNDQMIGVKQLSEFYIRDIKPEDFDMSKLDQNGDGVIKIVFNGNDNSWKKGWTIDGARLLAQ